MPVQRHHGYDWPEPDSDVYVDHLTGKPGRIDRLLPHETPLHFDIEFCRACCEAHEELGLGGYCNGWEL